MAHVIYSNYILAQEIEDQYNSYLDLARFCTVDNSLVGTPGMIKKINVYRATDGTEKLTMGLGNSRDIEVSYTDEQYEIQMAQNRFYYFDEQEMTDPMVVTTGLRHMATDMFNTVNADIFAEFGKVGTSQTIYTGSTNTAIDFGSFVDAVALLNVEGAEDATNTEVFAFVAPGDMAALRKTLKDDLKYVESYVRTGYIGTVGGVNLYTKKDAVVGTILGGTRQAVTLFNNYTSADFAAVKAQENTPLFYALEFSDGSKFSWQGQHTCGITGKGVDEVVEFQIHIAASTAVEFTAA